MKLLLLLPVLLLATFASLGSGQGVSRAAPFCTGTQLAGTFRVVPGSAGAGSTVYALRLQNRSERACSVTGLPLVQLVGRTGRALPTHLQAARPGALRPVLLTLGPGQVATATARLSPDVPGPGEPRLPKGQCEPKAYRLRVAALGGGTMTVSVQPPTPVCEHGSLQLTAHTRS